MASKMPDSVCSALQLEALESRLLLNGDWTGTWKIEGFFSELDHEWTQNGHGYEFDVEPFSGKMTIAEQGGGYNLSLTVQGDKASLDMQESGDSLEYQSLGYGDDDAWQRFHIKLIEVEPNVALFIGGDGAWQDASMEDLRWATSLTGIATRGKVDNVHRPWTGSYQADYYEIEEGAIDLEEGGRLVVAPTGTVSQYAWTYYDSDSEDGSAGTTTPKGDLFFAKNSTGWDDGDYEYSYVKVLRGPGDYLLTYEAHAGFGDELQTQLQWCDSAVSLIRPEAGSEYQYKPDLVCSYDTGKAPASLIAGASFKLPVVIGNEGSAPAAGTATVNVYARQGETRVLLGSADANLKTKTGGATTVLVTCTLPAELEAGSYSLITEIDTDGQIDEIDAGNNDSAQTVDLVVAAANADLSATLSSLKLPANPVGGGAAQAKLALGNLGNVAINEPLDIDLFLSTDPILDEADLPVATLADQKIALKPGQTKTLTANYNLPTGQPDGNYYLLTRVAEPAQVPDANPANNVAASPSFFLAEGAVNLTGSFGTKGIPAQLVPGGKTQVKLTLLNSGTVTATGLTNLQLWASGDGILDENDTLLAGLSNQKIGLKAGAAKTYSFKFTFPGQGLNPDDIFLIGRVDSQNTIAESNESDNLALGQ